MNLQFAHKAVLAVKNVNPTVLTVAGIAGVVTAAVMGARATLKVKDVVESHEWSMAKAKELKGSTNAAGEDFPYPAVATRIHVDTTLKYVRLYGPAVVVGIVSIAAISGGHAILLNRNTALAGALAATEKAYAKYRKAVVAEVGEEREKEIHYGRTVEQIHDTKAGTVTDVVKLDLDKAPYARFFDESNVNWSTAAYNKMFLTTQQEYANQRLQRQGYLLLNDVYRSLGLPKTTAGAVCGWAVGVGDGYVDFGMYDFDGPQGEAKLRFAEGDERSILLDFNVAGPVYHLIGDNH